MKHSDWFNEKEAMKNTKYISDLIGKN